MKHFYFKTFCIFWCASLFGFIYLLLFKRGRFNDVSSILPNATSSYSWKQKTRQLIHFLVALVQSCLHSLILTWQIFVWRCLIFSAALHEYSLINISCSPSLCVFGTTIIIISITVCVVIYHYASSTSSIHLSVMCFEH